MADAVHVVEQHDPMTASDGPMVTPQDQNIDPHPLRDWELTAIVNTIVGSHALEGVDMDRNRVADIVKQVFAGPMISLD